tara:strand:+ start:79 stop:312 length:234 start_codon:yes stop_codon:yes gene_type:complete
MDTTEQTRALCDLVVNRHGSQRAAAAHMGVAEASISKWRAGKQPMGMVTRLAFGRELGISADMIVAGCDPTKVVTNG